MKSKNVNRVKLTDKMVLVGLGLAAIYWFLDTFLFIFMSYDVQIFNGLFGMKLSDIWTRVIVCCLFVIFGSHSQVTINNRKVIEEEIRRREERYRTIIENTEDGYYELDRKGRLTFFNDSICEISGYSRADLVGKEIQKTLAEESVQTVMDSFETVLKTGAPVRSVEWTLQRADKEIRYVESSISLIAATDGESTGFKGFLRDVTKRKRAEALQQEKLAAEAASKSKSEFLANMSHEIRTPLNSIIGLVELLLDTKLSEDQKEDLSVINSAAHALLALINDILDFSKIEAGKLALDTTCFQLRSFLGESLRIMASTANEKRNELAFRVAPGVPDRLTGDPDRFRQIVLNLVGNALKFTEKGEVVVEVEREKETDTGVLLHFSVRDTGIGIPTDKQEGIFRTFEQADGSTSRRYGGTGLGLAVSSQLVGLMGGKIWVESEPGTGSTFHFTVDLAIADDDDCTTLSEIAESLKGMKTLVIDDNLSVQGILQELLESWGLPTIAVSGPDEAIQQLDHEKESGHPYGLAIIDTDMPDIDPLSLVEQIRNHEHPDTRQIMMLTPSSLKKRSQLQAMGVKAFVSKPVSPPDLMYAINVAMGLAAEVSGQTEGLREVEEANRGRSLRILIAEDTPFNQKFITRLLDRWQHTAVIADNGKEAIDILDRESFDLILMDVQMPEMDGFEATQIIREREKMTGNHVPIIAMTAHAMKGDRERCISVGMDDYVAKPISTEALEESIRNLIYNKEPAPSAIEAAMKDAEPVAKPDAFDKSALLEAFDHDWDFLKETVDMLLEDYPPMLEEIHHAITEKDSVLLRRTAHALKGMVGNFQAKAAAKAALELEEMGRMGEMTGVEKAYGSLVDEMNRFKSSIGGMLEKEKP